MTQEKISIVTVTKNDCIALEKTFLSLKKIDKRIFEYIVVDGNSSDSTKEIINSFRGLIDKVLIEDDDGIYNAMNKGLKLASSSHVIFLNAGDTLIPESFKILIDNIKKGTFFYGDVFIQGKYNKKLLKAKDFTLRNFLIYGTSTLCHQSFVYERDLFEGYNEKFKFKAELHSYFSILKKKYNVKYLNVPLVVYESYGNGTKFYLKNSIELFGVIISQSFIFLPFAVYLFLKMIIYRTFLFISRYKKV